MLFKLLFEMFYERNLHLYFPLCTSIYIYRRPRVISDEFTDTTLLLNSIHMPYILPLLMRLSGFLWLFGVFSTIRHQLVYSASSRLWFGASSVLLWRLSIHIHDLIGQIVIIEVNWYLKFNEPVTNSMSVQGNCTNFS